jgi:hypothetical protein
MNYYRMYDITKTYSIGLGASVGRAVDYWEGKICLAHVRVPATLSGAGGSAGALSIENGSGYTIYTFPESISATNTSYNLGASAIPVPCNDMTVTKFTLTASAACASVITVLYKLYGSKGD